MKTIARVTAVVVTAALLAALPAAADAAVRRIRIKPNDLLPFAAHQDHGRIGYLNRGTTGPVLFWQRLNIPRGARIRGVSYRRIASNANQTIVGVDRVRAGAAPSWQRLFNAASANVTALGTIGELVKGTPTAVNKTVRRGWTYFVLVQGDIDAGVGDIVVRYSVP